MTVQTDNYGIGASGTASQKFTFTAPNDGTFKLGRGVLGAESSFPIVVNADDSISGVFSGLGVGQTWQDMIGSMVLGTTYTNSTGKPIALNVYSIQSTLSLITATVAGVPVKGSQSVAGGGHSVFAIVPNGATYSVTVSGGTTSGLSWIELR